MPETGEKTTAELLAQRAEDDARRWEAAAVAMEQSRNEANERRAAAEAQVEIMRTQVKDAAYSMIEALDDLAARIAATFKVRLPNRCDHDDDL